MICKLIGKEECVSLFSANGSPASTQFVDAENWTISGLAVCTVGEARGHELWVDLLFLSQLKIAIDATPGGVPARWGHPENDTEAVTSYAAQINGAFVAGEVLRANASFVNRDDKTSSFLKLAQNHPRSFGASIHCLLDLEGMRDFAMKHGAATGAFKSPDARNRKNLPHARLQQLWAVDFVQNPAANPNGLFSGGQQAGLTLNCGPANLTAFAASVGVDLERLNGPRRK